MLLSLKNNYCFGTQKVRDILIKYEMDAGAALIALACELKITSFQPPIFLICHGQEKRKKKRELFPYTF